MAHIRIDYAPMERLASSQLVVVRVLVGPAPRAIRPAGHLQLHPAELNALDRLLTRGAQFEEPANTYALHRNDDAIYPEADEDLLSHVERRLVEAGS